MAPVPRAACSARRLTALAATVAAGFGSCRLLVADAGAPGVRAIPTCRAAELA